jgi:hypothetical protein
MKENASLWRIAVPLGSAVALAAAVAFAVPRAAEAVQQLMLEDDAAALAAHRLEQVASAPAVDLEISDALASNDIDLANSFAELARDRGLAIDPVLGEKIAAANTATATTLRGAQRFVRGFVVGDPDDATSFAGTALGDLFVYGDLRDAARESWKIANGESADEIVLGLACVGIAITAGTYATLGAAAPARASLTLVKTARRTGKLSAPLGAAVTRALRETVDTTALRRAVTSVSWRDPALTVRGVREAVKLDKAGALTRMAGDIGRVQTKAGTRATLDGLKMAQGPRDLSRLAKVAEKQGSKTRAVIKLLGRAAIATALISFQAASWMMTAILATIGFCAAIKSTVENATWRYVRWRKAQRCQTLALQPTPV